MERLKLRRVFRVAKQARCLVETRQRAGLADHAILHGVARARYSHEGGEDNALKGFLVCGEDRATVRFLFLDFCNGAYDGRDQGHGRPAPYDVCLFFIWEHLEGLFTGSFAYQDLFLRGRLPQCVFCYPLTTLT